MSKQELVDKNEVLSIWHNYWESDKLAYEAEDELRELKTIICITELNENQQIVLNWLKEEMKKENMFPISCLWKLQSWHAPKNVCSAYLALDKDRQFQLLSSFSEWFEQEKNKNEFQV